MRTAKKIVVKANIENPVNYKYHVKAGACKEFQVIIKYINQQVDY